MYGISQQKILSFFNTQDYCKILTLTMSSQTTPNRAKYMSSIALPSRTISPDFITEKDANDKAIKVSNVNVKMNYGTVSIPLNNKEDFDLVLAFFKVLSRSKDSNFEMLNNTEKYLTEAKKSLEPIATIPTKPSKEKDAK